MKGTADNGDGEGDRSAMLPGSGDGEVRGEGVENNLGGPGAALPGGASVPSASSEASAEDSSDGYYGAEGGAASGGAGPIEPPSPTPLPNAGILTAGVWDDNRNFERFLGYRSTWEAQQLPGLLPIDEQELNAAHLLWTNAPAAHDTVDIALVIDTTGSMGDEIAYLQAEFSALSTSIAQRYPRSAQRWSLVDYKDTSDWYIVRYFDFRSDLEQYREQLAKLNAGGGGDFPESPERGLAAAEQFSWRTSESAAKLVFWVGDAPHHVGQEKALAEALRGLKGLGVHVYPVASSGVDDLTELSMRTAAMLTGGRYLFLTNDSGVGNDHKEPTIPCYFVTSLRDAIERMVDVELSGEYHEPAAAQVYRTGGDPQDGACKLRSGDSVIPY